MCENCTDVIIYVYMVSRERGGQTAGVLTGCHTTIQHNISLLLWNEIKGKVFGIPECLVFPSSHQSIDPRMLYVSRVV